MKILIVNVHSVRNAGDDALLQAALQQLRRQFPDATFTLAMNDRAGYTGPETTVDSFIHWFRKRELQNSPLRAWRWLAMPGLLLYLRMSAIVTRWTGRTWALTLSTARHDLLRAYHEAEMVVSCPGGYLYSTGKLGLWFLVTLLTLAYPCWLGKPVYLLPQTIGPLQYRWERWLLRRLLPRIRQIYVRDDYSRTVLVTSGVAHPEIYLTPDLAFGYQEAERKAGAMLLRQLGVDPDREAPLMGVTLINWAGMESSFHGQDAYEYAIAETIRSFVTRYGGRVVLFAQVRGPALAEDDRIPARRVKQQLQELGEAIVLVEDEVTTAQLKAAYSYMTLFVGSRLHSNIFALTSAVPVLAIAYLPKTWGVMQMLGLTDWVIDIDGVNAEKLFALLDQLYRQRATIQAQVVAAMEAQQLRLQAMGQAIGEDYRHWQEQQQ